MAGETRDEREAIRNTTLHAVRRMAEAWNEGGVWPARGEPGFEDTETVQMNVAGSRVWYEIIGADGELHAVVRVEDDGRLVLDEHPGIDFAVTVAADAAADALCYAHGPHGARCMKPAGHDGEHRDGFGEGSGGWKGDARDSARADVGRRDAASEPRAGVRVGQAQPIMGGTMGPSGPGNEPDEEYWRRRRPAHGGYPGVARDERAEAHRADGSRPDLVSRMLDARSCLRAWTPARARDVGGALRWLDEGIEQGMRERGLRAELRQLVEGEPHICSCDIGTDGIGCSEPYVDRCRFEAALRRLLGGEDG